jgi:hypothetical protein
MHVYEVRPRKDHRGVDLISDVLPFGGLLYVHEARSTIKVGPANAIVSKWRRSASSRDICCHTAESKV